MKKLIVIAIMMAAATYAFAGGAVHNTVGNDLKGIDVTEGQEGELTPEPKELYLARNAYNNQIKAATDPIKNKYIQTLEALKKRFGAAGNTDGMIAVQKELDSIKNVDNAKNDEKDTKVEINKIEKQLDGKWSFARKSDPGTIQFNKDLTCQWSSGINGKYKINTKNIIIEWDNNVKFEISLPLNVKGTKASQIGEKDSYSGILVKN